MNNGIHHANEVIKKFYISKPCEYSIEDIIDGLRGPEINYQPMKRGQGRILHGDKYSIITINSKINHEGRRRFTLSHELGHYIMHRDQNYFYCNEENLMDWNEYNKKETEANYFASELLMPTNIFYKYSSKEMFTIKSIKYLAETFQTSITATSIKYAEYGYDPIFLICSKGGTIKWFKYNNDFCFFVDLTKIRELPKTSLTYESVILGNNVGDDAVEIDPLTWNIDHKGTTLKFYESCFTMTKYNYTLTYLSIRE